MDRKTKYFLAALFIALPFPFMLLFSHPGLGATTVLVLIIPVVVYLMYRQTGSKPSRKPPAEGDGRG